jgi:hypothetical protein
MRSVHDVLELEQFAEFLVGEAGALCLGADLLD